LSQGFLTLKLKSPPWCCQQAPGGHPELVLNVTRSQIEDRLSVNVNGDEYQRHRLRDRDSGIAVVGKRLGHRCFRLQAEIDGIE
jgi:hypothetical protein